MTGRRRPRERRAFLRGTPDVAGRSRTTRGAKGLSRSSSASSSPPRKELRAGPRVAGGANGLAGAAGAAAGGGGGGQAPEGVEGGVAGAGEGAHGPLPALQPEAAIRRTET